MQNCIHSHRTSQRIFVKLESGRQLCKQCIWTLYDYHEWSEICDCVNFVEVGGSDRYWGGVGSVELITQWKSKLKCIKIRALYAVSFVYKISLPRNEMCYMLRGKKQKSANSQKPREICVERQDENETPVTRDVDQWKLLRKKNLQLILFHSKSR